MLAKRTPDTLSPPPLLLHTVRIITSLCQQLLLLLPRLLSPTATPPTVADDVLFCLCGSCSYSNRGGALLLTRFALHVPFLPQPLNVLTRQGLN